MDEVLKYIFEYLVMGQLKFGMENRFIILLKYNQNCPQQQSPSALLLLASLLLGAAGRFYVLLLGSFMKFLEHYFNDRICASVFNYGGG